VLFFKPIADSQLPTATLMWKQEIHKLLKMNQIAFEFVKNQSVFEMLFIPEHQLYLHLINIKTFQDNSLPNTYFQSLSDSYNTQNQRVIHLWEDIYSLKQDLIHARILAMTGTFARLHARHCIVKRIDMPIAESFLDKNHLQGSVKAKFKYGLFLKPQYVEKYLGISVYDDVESLAGIDFSINHREPSNHNPNNLVAAGTFSGGRTMKVGERAGTRSYELIRFASLKGYVVVGGMNKLLKAFTEEHQPDDIMSYADRDWSDGRSYEKLGFIKIKNSLPQTFHIDLNTFHRLLVNRITDEKYLDIFNAGSIKYIKILKYLG
jgi:hypothetical protein